MLSIQHEHAHISLSERFKKPNNHRPLAIEYQLVARLAERDLFPIGRRTTDN